MLSLTTLFFIKVSVGYRHPREYDIEHEDVMIPTENGIRIHVWLLKQSNSLGYPTNIFFHGNSGIPSEIGLQMDAKVLILFLNPQLT
ncbi:unnamed protein product [Albugo candida]|uniref:Uncharacterized protein n=1 Tax=Albugo candida TaxID=65357 RepID=A0A024GNS9_9STRA|nr:unnamed protein product [Albugo candida]|eukprot:CCI47997.1 unnamed protein product [Albugo candida]